MATNPPAKPGVDAFHRERSKCLDAFVGCEEAVVALLLASATKAGAEPLGLKIEALKKAKPSPSYPATRKQTINGLLGQFDDLLELRNDLVHSRLQIAAIGEDQKACFINARQSSTGAQSARLFSLESLRSVTRKASELAGKLKQA
ncbi:MAG: hypothetical protein ACKOPQ_15790 [Novosphingobium sp.]